jgi:hypothetical protein
MTHNRDLARVARGRRARLVRQFTDGVFTLRQRLSGWPRLVARIVRWRHGKLYAFGKLEEIEARLDRDRRPM